MAVEMLRGPDHIAIRTVQGICLTSLPVTPIVNPVCLGRRTFPDMAGSHDHRLAGYALRAVSRQSGLAAATMAAALPAALHDDPADLQRILI